MRVASYCFYVLITVVLLLEACLWLLMPLAEGVEGPIMPRTTYHQDLPGLKPVIVLETNNYGLRSVSLKKKPKPGNTIRIFCIGASTTIEWTHETADMWSGKLEQKLNAAFADSSTRFEVAAFGKGGEKVWDGYRYTETFVKEFDPDFVVTLWGINSLAWNGGPGYTYPGKDQMKQIALDKKRSDLNQNESWIKSFLRKYSQIFRRMRYLKDGWKSAKEIKKGNQFNYESNVLPHLQSEYRKLPVTNTITRNPDPIHEFEDGLDQLVTSIRNIGAVPVVMTQPVLWSETLSETSLHKLWFPVMTPEGKKRMSIPWLTAEINRFNQVQKNIAQKHGAILVPLDDLMSGKEEYFFDDCHFTLDGSEAVANALFTALLPAVKDRAVKFSQDDAHDKQ